MPDHTTPSDATRDEEAKEAKDHADGGRTPTAEEVAAADQNTVQPGVAEAEKDMNTRGANVKGEGQVP